MMNDACVVGCVGENRVPCAWLDACRGVVVVERAGLNNGAIPVFDSYLQVFKVDIVDKYVLREHRDLVAAQVPSN